jgi:hypothetical protein
MQAEGGRLGSSPVHGVNQWPTQLPSFDAVLRNYIASCLQLGASLMRGNSLIHVLTTALRFKMILSTINLNYKQSFTTVTSIMFTVITYYA